MAAVTIGLTVNPYAVFDTTLDRPDGAKVRRHNLEAYLRSRVGRTRLILVGEAAGYQGCRFSGIAFTSERSLSAEQWSSVNPAGWIEPSATIVHDALAELEIEDVTVLWNICPLHPADAVALSNRKPTQREIREGKHWLDKLVDLIGSSKIVAVGRSAASVLPRVPHVRHPAHGGAAEFRSGLRAIRSTL